MVSVIQLLIHENMILLLKIWIAVGKMIFIREDSGTVINLVKKKNFKILSLLLSNIILHTTVLYNTVQCVPVFFNKQLLKNFFYWRKIYTGKIGLPGVPFTKITLLTSFILYVGYLIPVFCWFTAKWPHIKYITITFVIDSTTYLHQ
jgi:hypothetical protein